MIISMKDMVEGIIKQQSPLLTITGFVVMEKAVS
jgi:hypothetical protein